MLNNSKNYWVSIVLDVIISDITLLLKTVRIVFLFYRTFIAKTYAGFIYIATKIVHKYAYVDIKREILVLNQ